MLNSEVYRNASFLEKSAWKQAALILLAALSYPLLFLVWLIFDSCFPSHNLARIFRSPCVKFLIHCGSYQTFLFLLAFSAFVSTLRHSKNSRLNSLQLADFLTTASWSNQDEHALGCSLSGPLVKYINPFMPQKAKVTNSVKFSNFILENTEKQLKCHWKYCKIDFIWKDPPINIDHRIKSYS